jgi:hypothetical protein
LKIFNYLNWEDVGIQIAFYEISLTQIQEASNVWQIKMAYHDSGDHPDPHLARDDAFKPLS